MKIINLGLSLMEHKGPRNIALRATLLLALLEIEWRAPIFILSAPSANSIKGDSHGKHYPLYPV